MLQRAPLTCLALALLGAASTAQWSSDPAVNLALGDGAGEQVQVKLVAALDGGFFLSWYDSNPSGSPAFGYDVRVQRLDSGGREMFAHNGVLVADRGFSSTQDYGLDVGADGAALVAFRDDRGSGIQITAAKVDGDGNLVWGSAGVQLTSTTQFVASPKICGLPGGGAMVAWTQDTTTRLRRLDATGATTGSELVLTPGGGSYSVSDLHGADGASVIVAFVLQTGGFGSPRHVFAQKFDGSDTPLWGAGHVAVFDGGSLQFGNFPTFVHDGSGGGVFGWYSSSPALECRAQRILANGSEAFPHNGVSASTNAAQLRVAPSVAFDPTTQATRLAYVELNSTQSQSGVSAQSFDATGARLWGTTGVALVPLGTPSRGDVRAVLFDGGDCLVSWSDSPSFGQDVLRAAILDDTGATAVAAFDLASTPSVKFRLAAARSTLGHAALAWRDERAGDPDIYGQHVLPGGGLAGLASVTSRNGSGLNPSCYSSLTPPVLGKRWETAVDTTFYPGAGLSVTFGYSQPGTGPVLLIGEVLISPGSARLYSKFVTTTSGIDVHDPLLPADLGLIGATAYTQALVLGGPVGQLCNALDPVAGL